MLTIMGGEWKGRKLLVPSSHQLRPTAGRVKSAIFSILESYRMKQGLSASLQNAVCLDLFAGVGGLGFEAISRGASRCVFVEKDRAHLRALKLNREKLGCETETIVVDCPVERSQRFLTAHGPFDYVFLDPPYDLPNLASYLDFIVEHVALNPGAMLIFEHRANEELPIPERLELHSARKLGPASLSIFISKI